MAGSKLGYLGLILALMALTWETNGNETQFCLEQEETFQVCSSRMEFFYFARSQSLDILCKEIAQYLSCVHETNVSCPDMPIFQDRAYTEAIQNAMIQLARFCKGYSISTKCNERFVNHLVSKCTTILNQVQVDIPREDMCQYSKEYLVCLQRATEICPNNTEFLLLNVPLAIASTESALRASCDDVQMDNPVGSVVQEESPIHALCTSDIISDAVDRCRSHVEHPPAEMDVNGCRHQQKFVSCLDLLLKNCNNAEEVYKPMLTEASETYLTLCSARKCPKEVEDGVEDAVSYCMMDFYDLEPSHASYCKQLKLVPACIQDLTTNCPPVMEPHHLEGALVMIDRVIEDNCGSVNATRD